MNDEQKDSDVTVEVYDGVGNESFAAELRIADDNHDCLDEGHPVIWADMESAPEDRRDDIVGIAHDIGL